MASSGGISGLAVGLAGVGGWLLYAGLKNVPLFTGLRDIAAGKVPTSKGSDVATANAAAASELGTTTPLGATSANGNNTMLGYLATGDAIVAVARRYLGKPYKFGGAQNPSVGFDCSGLANWVFGHDLNYPLPGQSKPGFDGSSHGPIVMQYWSGWAYAFTIAGPPGPGDLVIYGPNTHMGIAISATQMIHAPDFGQVVKVENFWPDPGRIFKRVVQAGNVNASGGNVDPTGRFYGVGN